MNVLVTTTTRRMLIQTLGVANKYTSTKYLVDSVYPFALTSLRHKIRVRNSSGNAIFCSNLKGKTEVRRDTPNVSNQAKMFD